MRECGWRETSGSQRAGGRAAVLSPRELVQSPAQPSPLLCSVREREALVAQKQGSWTGRRKTAYSLVLLCFVFLVRHLLPQAAVGEKRGGAGTEPQAHPHTRPRSLPHADTQSVLKMKTSGIPKGDWMWDSAAPIDSNPSVSSLSSGPQFPHL